MALETKQPVNLKAGGKKTWGCLPVCCSPSSLEPGSGVGGRHAAARSPPISTIFVHMQIEPFTDPRGDAAPAFQQAPFVDLFSLMQKSRGPIQHSPLLL